MERLGLGPDELLKANPKLVYGRVTGWGQEGPLAQEAGHDINYVALTGLLHGIGPKERPTVPINYLGDYAGGGMMLAFGMVAALLAVQRGGEGQVIDAAMTDGAALIGALTYGLRAAGHVARRAGIQPARRRRADLRHLSLPRRQVPQHWARSSRSSAKRCSRGLALARAQATRKSQRSSRSRTRDAVGGPFRRHGCLRRAGARPGRSAGPSAQSGAAHVHRSRRRVPAGAGAALFGNRRSIGPTRPAAKGRTARLSLPSSAMARPKSKRF